MTDNTKKSNNLFDFATSELSQDAFFCWSLNWLSVKEDTEDPYYKYGKAMLDLFLGDNKKVEYTDVHIKKQFVVEFKRDENNNPIKTDNTSSKKAKGIIDILVLFKDGNVPHALIIEDKTHTSEQSNQIAMYKNNLPATLNKSNDAEIKTYKNVQNIHTAYVKTGIMYCENLEVDSIVDFDSLYKFFKKAKTTVKSDIILDFYNHLNSTKQYYDEIEKNINLQTYIDENGKDLLKQKYGQYYFLKKYFYQNGSPAINREGKVLNKLDNTLFINNIKHGTNTSGSLWTHYRFYFYKYPQTTHKSGHQNEYCFFWRIDRPKEDDNSNYSKAYLSLHHYWLNNQNENKEIHREHNKNLHDFIVEYHTYIQKKYLISNHIELPERNCFSAREYSLFRINIEHLKTMEIESTINFLKDISNEIIHYCKNYKDN